jgi:NAD(P)-dependent dehydrogenase (short-subunit alcohol dehydrogenase family)
MKDKLVLITGANAGIGKATAVGLAKLNAEIILLCRDRNRGEKARKEIARQSNNEKVHLMICDLSLQKEIRKFADEFKRNFRRLDVLINNAAAVSPHRKETEEGIELQFAVNYLAPFLMTHLLSGLIILSAPSRIINVSSQVHANTEINFEDINSEKSYSISRVYAMTKHANVLFTYKLAEILNGKNVTANALHPGVYSTKLLKDLKSKTIFHKAAVKLLYDSPAKGAETPVFLAASEEAEGLSGKYFIDKKSVKSSNATYDKETQQKLWDLSIKLTGLKPSESVLL